MIDAYFILLEWLRAVVPYEVKVYYWAAQDLYFNPWFWAFTLSIFVAEWRWPADTKQRVFSPGLAQDFVWFNMDAAFKVAALPAVAGFLALSFDALTGGFRVPVLESWSVPTKIVISVLVFDFLQWFHHWVRHKVLAFWHFHAVHHSQREMNVFTDLRVHAGEYIISEALVFVPMIVLGLTPWAVMGVAGARWWWTRFIHANIRTNCGPFKVILVTPQFHRVHHSIEPQHQDLNYGVVFSVWDRLFGTLHSDYDEYPATGVEGLPFAPPATLNPLAWLKDYAVQFMYPFRALLGSDRTR